MRHRKSFNHLGRTSSHRKAMLANMASSLIMHKRIKTTLQKAKELRVYVEPLITKSKEDSTHSRRVVFTSLQDKNAVTELFREVAPKIADRPGGYTRILKLDNRLGDSAEMCYIELVDFNENLIGVKETAKAKSRRRRGSKKATVKTEPDTEKPIATEKEVPAEPEMTAGEEDASTESTTGTNPDESEISGMEEEASDKNSTESNTDESENIDDKAE